MLLHKTKTFLYAADGLVIASPYYTTTLPAALWFGTGVVTGMGMACAFRRVGVCRFCFLSKKQHHLPTFPPPTMATCVLCMSTSLPPLHAHLPHTRSAPRPFPHPRRAHTAALPAFYTLRSIPPAMLPSYLWAGTFFAGIFTTAFLPFTSLPLHSSLTFPLPPPLPPFLFILLMLCIQYVSSILYLYSILWFIHL